MEKICSFTNHKNDKLYGIVNIPLETKRKIGIVLLNTGLNYRVAWHRLNVKIARILCAEGYFVLRFDTHGIGDSEGELDAGGIVQHFGSIQKGLFVQDAIDGISQFIKNEGLNKIYLFGLCGGALTAMYVATRTKYVDGIIHIAGPITMSSAEHLEKNTPWEAANILAQYSSNLFSLKSWLRFITGGSDYKTLKSAIVTWMKSCNKVNAMKDWQINTAENRKDAWSNLNIDFIEAFIAYCSSGRKILFIFAEKDSVTWEFERMFLSVLKEKKIYDKNYKCHVIKNTNHVFSDQVAQESLITLVKKWLKQVA